MAILSGHGLRDEAIERREGMEGEHEGKGITIRSLWEHILKGTQYIASVSSVASDARLSIGGLA